MAQPGTFNRFLITVAVMSAALMQVLDMTIISVALPNMQGELNASPDQISWVLTTYLISSAIFMPLTGYFTDRLGQKKFLLLSILGFVVASALCGLSASVEQIVLFRVAQGISGAALIPLSQAIMVGLYPPEERARAMAIWGAGVMLGPVLGPALGGFLTDWFGWRWTFFVNLPIGFLSMILAWRLAPDTPVRARTMDWTGFIFLALAIGSLQLVLDRGNQEDWFESNLMTVFAAIAVLGGVALLLRGASAAQSVVKWKIFADANFAKASLFLGVFGLGMFGCIVLRPLLMESLLGYPPAGAGLLQAPSGIASIISMMFVSRLMKRFEPRLVVTTGVLLSAIGTYYMTYYDLSTPAWLLVWPLMVQGFGIGLIFTPLSTIAFSTLPPRDAPEAAGVYSLVRTIGSSIGISAHVVIMTRQTQAAWAQLGTHIQRFNPMLDSYLERLDVLPVDSAGAQILGQEVGRQALMLGILDGFVLNTACFLILLLLVPLLPARRSARQSAVKPVVATPATK